MKVRTAAAFLFAVSLPLAAAFAAPAGEVDLAPRVAELERQLASESGRVEAARPLWDQELAALEARRAALAREVLDLEDAARDLEGRARRIEARRHELERAASARHSRLDAFLSHARSFAEQLDIQLAELPGSENDATAIREAMAGLEPSTHGAPLRSASALLERAVRLHRGATRVETRYLDLRTTTGKVERCVLLSVGQVAFAYFVTGFEEVPGRGGALGVALRSPMDASGFRWTEDIPPAFRDELDLAFRAKATESSTRRIVVPIDPSGELRVEDALGRGDLKSTIVSGGLVMVPIGLVALAALVLVLERLLYLGRQRIDVEALFLEVLGLCRAGNHADAEATSRAAGGVAGRVLAAALARRGQGRQAMEDGVQEQLLHELPSLQRFLGAIALLGTVAPLLGLLGTVTGIIETFSTIQAYGNTNPKLMAGGVSEALVTTAAGLIVAIPIVLLHGLVRGRSDAILGDAEKYAATLLNELAGASPAERQAAADGPRGIDP